MHGVGLSWKPGRLTCCAAQGADAGAAPGAFLGPAVVQGLAGVLSTVDAALLRFPKVAEEYTSLAASALESFPQQVQL